MLVAGVVLTLAGCDVRVRPATAPAATGGGSGTAAAIVGTWRRVLLVEHDGGDLTRSTTTWTFTTGGTCERAVETFTLSAGFADTARQACSWSVEGATLRIAYGGSAPPASFSWHIEGGTLYLSGIPFTRA